jgi:hypothetical protein
MPIEKQKKIYDVQDIINVEYNLKPLKCRFCGDMKEVTFYSYIMDAHCATCGEWQLSPERKRRTKCQLKNQFIYGNL